MGSRVLMIEARLAPMRVMPNSSSGMGMTVLQPLAALLLARYAFHLPHEAVRAVTIVAALPSAQNIYVISMRYGVRELFARDTIFTATAVSALVILALVTLL